MKHNFDYFYDTRANDSFLVEDISNFTINALNDSGLEWYFDIRTELGNSYITKFGPIFVDDDTLSSANKTPFKFEYFVMPYDEGKIIKRVDSFINEPKSAITQILEIDREQFSNRLKEIMNVTC